MLRTIIVDDEPIIRADIESLLRMEQDIEVIGACGSVKDAIIIIQDLKPDLLLLDIQLTDGNSFEIFKALPALDCMVIFITAYDKHAIRAIRIGALDYLLKPVAEEELAAALEKVRRKKAPALALQLKEAQRHLEGKEDETAVKTIVLSSQKNVQVVAYSDIIYCEGDGNYTTFFLTDHKKVMVSRPLKEYDELLPDQQFIRTHQSYLVNLQFVERYERDGMLRMQDGTEVPVAVRKRESVRAYLTGRAS